MLLLLLRGSKPISVVVLTSVLVFGLVAVSLPYRAVAAFGSAGVCRSSSTSRAVASRRRHWSYSGSTERMMSVHSNSNDVTTMPPPLPQTLSTTFYLLRHGQSTANVAGIISSSPSLMYSDKHGLTELGQQQARQAAEDLRIKCSTSSTDQPKPPNNNNNNNNTSTQITFYSSPLARAKQTAEFCLERWLELMESDDSDYSSSGSVTINPQVQMEDSLVERYFGRLDDTDIRTYSYVWPQDLLDVTHTSYRVESVARVAQRVRSALLRIDENHHDNDTYDQVAVLVSHADVLQITQLYGTLLDDTTTTTNNNNNINVGSFSSYRFGNGEVRLLGRTRDTLPDPVPLEMPQWEPGEEEAVKLTFGSD